MRRVDCVEGEVLFRLAGVSMYSLVDGERLRTMMRWMKLCSYLRCAQRLRLLFIRDEAVQDEKEWFMREDGLKLDEVSTNTKTRCHQSVPPSHLEPHQRPLASPPITQQRTWKSPTTASNLPDAIECCEKPEKSCDTVTALFENTAQFESPRTTPTVLLQHLERPI